MTTNRAPEALLQALRQGHRFVLTGHRNPDGDAIGSALALARILRKQGKSCVVWNADPTPKVYTAMPGSERIHVGEEPPSGYPELFDAVVVLECPDIERTGLAEQLAQRPVLNVDHHLGNQHYGKVNWVDTAAPALGEMIHRLAQGLMVPLDEDTADALFLTLVTDTGGFRFPNATARAFEAAAVLVKEGARPERVAGWLYDSQPASALRLTAEMLSTLELHGERNGVATALLTRAMFERAGAQPGDSEGLIDHPRSIAGVEAVALLRELADGGVKVSLRSRGEHDVQAVADRHGGGGHRNAAGFTASGKLEEVRKAVVAELLVLTGPEGS